MQPPHVVSNVAKCWPLFFYVAAEPNYAPTGVVAVPASAFYMHPEHGVHLVRFACCKQLGVIDSAVDRLVAAFG